jgi:hypothetical protein
MPTDWDDFAATVRAVPRLGCRHVDTSRDVVKLSGRHIGIPAYFRFLRSRAIRHAACHIGVA